MRKIGLLCLLVLLAAGAPAANQGVVYEIEITNYEQGGGVDNTQVLVEGRNLTMQIAPGAKRGSGKMIYRGGRREMVVVDHEDKSYFVMDEAAMQSIKGQVSAVADQIEEALKNVPEDQRAQIEKMMKERMSQQGTPGSQRTPSEILITSEQATHAGYPCVKYEVLREGRKVRELWVTDWDNITGARETRAVFEDMASFFKDMMASLPSSVGGSGLFAADSSPFEELDQLEGFPVLTREFEEEGELESESLLKSVREVTLDPDAFEPPAGYKRRSMGPQ